MTLNLDWSVPGRSKDESGFLAVPLVQKGVVVVAVGYSIAPKGTADTCWSELKRIMGNGYVVCVCLQGTWIWWCHRCAGAWCQWSSSIHTSGPFMCDVEGWLMGRLSFMVFLCPSAAGFTCVVILPERTWPLWFCPQIGPSTTYHRKSKVCRWTLNTIIAL